MAPKFLPAGLARGLRASGENPAFPPALRKPGASYRVLAKYCISPTGTVEQVKIVQSGGAQLDEIVQSTVKQWRFRPYLSASGLPVPFCTLDAFEFRTE
jgi:TonB family protein